MDYEALKAELDLPEYAGLDDAAAAEHGNAKTNQVPVPVQAVDVKRYLHMVGKWAGIRAAALGIGAPSLEKQLAAITLLDALDAFSAFDLTNQSYAAAINAQLTACMAQGIELIAETDKDAILALGMLTVPYLPTIGWPQGITEHDVARARSLPS